METETAQNRILPAIGRISVGIYSRFHLYYYSDVTVICGEPLFEDAEVDTLLNPTLIVEALSDSTERIDRRQKSDCYRTLPSLQMYVLVVQDEPRMESFTRQDNGAWSYISASGMDARMALPAIGCSLRLADVYARVRFPPFLDAEAEAAEPEGDTASQD